MNGLPDMLLLGYYKSLLLRRKQILRFLLVGIFGFCVDGGVLISLMNTDHGIVGSRVVSFLIAVTSTWILNRFWTFEKEKINSLKKIHKQYLLYVTSQVLGAVINFGVFLMLVSFSPALSDSPLVPLAAGALISLLFNYTTSKQYVFRG